ncbi:MAG: PA3496 family putative envelope integrity protein [Thermoanaerobaculia bacterium]
MDFDEVDTDRLDADERLAGFRRRVDDLLEAKRLRTAGSVDADGLHGRKSTGTADESAKLTKKRGQD